MSEAGSAPEVSRVRRLVSDVGRVLTSPLLPDDYFALLRPTWSTREVTGRVVRLRRETRDATTVVIKPDFEWPAHRPGQYLRLGLEIGGVRHFRAYTLTSDPDHPEGVVSVTVKHDPDGKVSPVLNHRVDEGTSVFLGDVEGEFTLPDGEVGPTLFVSAGSGITPLWAMVRELERRGALDDVVHVHSCRDEDDMIFGSTLRKLAETRDGYTLVEVHTATEPRLTGERLAELCPDWDTREIYLSGPTALIEEIETFADEHDRSDHVRTEHFQPVIGNGGGSGEGGTVHFRVSDAEVECEPGSSILVGGEEAGVKLDFGCRMGICHTCVGRLVDGAVRDLRTDAVETADGQMVRICINAPEGHVEIDL